MNYFAYDALLRRFAVQEASGLSYFTWDQNGMNLLAERDASGSVTAYYTHGYTPVDGIGSLVAAKRNEAGASYYQYPVYDHRGSVVRLLDENGTPTAYFEYDAWGTSLQSNVVGGTGTNRFRYQSNWIDLPDSGGDLYLSPTRVYHAATGRFLGRDRKTGGPDDLRLIHFDRRAAMDELATLLASDALRPVTKAIRAFLVDPSKGGIRKLLDRLPLARQKELYARYLDIVAAWRFIDRYSYARNNPLVGTDATGEFALLELLIVLAFLGMITSLVIAYMMGKDKDDEIQIEEKDWKIAEAWGDANGPIDCPLIGDLRVTGITTGDAAIPFDKKAQERVDRIGNFTPRILRVSKASSDYVHKFDAGISKFGLVVQYWSAFGEKPGRIGYIRVIYFSFISDCANPHAIPVDQVAEMFRESFPNMGVNR